MTNDSHRSRNTSEGIMGAIKANPEGLLLLAAGCALLMRSGSARSSSAGSSSFRTQSDLHRSEYSAERSRNLGDVASATAESARRYVADVGDKVAETAKDYASSIGNY